METGTIIIIIVIAVILIAIFGFLINRILVQNKIIEGSLEEIELLMKMKYKLINDLKEKADADIEGWVAKDACGSLFFYTGKPIRNLEIGSWFICKEEDLYIISSRLFPELTWKDEPIKISITYKK